MKRLLLILFLAASLAQPGRAQERKYSTFYYQRATLFEALGCTPTDIVFLGNSITNGAEWSELLGDARCKNRGISGDTTDGVFDRLEAILEGRPAKIFLMVGINDLARGAADTTVVRGIERIARRIRSASPRTQLYLQSVLPVNDRYGMFAGHTARRDAIPTVNEGIRAVAEATGARYVDLYSRFVDPESGKMRPELSNDGLHLLGAGYLLWCEILKPYVNE